MHHNARFIRRYCRIYSNDWELATAVLFSMGSVLGMDALMQHVTKIDSCARCVTARLDLFKRYGKPLIMATCIGAVTHFSHELSGHHDHFTENTETICGPEGKSEIQIRIPVFVPGE